jgi:SAM-dependent methyltransferase
VRIVRRVHRERLRAAVDRKTQLYGPTRQVRFRLTIDALESFAGPRPLRVLDAGTSDALLAETLARRHPHWSIDAVDLDEGALEIAEARIRRAGLDNVRVFQADLTESLGEATYDAVIALECLALIPDDSAAVASMARALCEGGLFVAHVQDKHWKTILRRAMPVWPGEVRHGYTPNEITALVENTGLRVASLVPTSRALAVIGRELVEHRASTLRQRVLWYARGVILARLDQAGATWGKPRGYFVTAYRPARTP